VLRKPPDRTAQTEPGEMPHSTHASLPALNPSPEPQPPPDPLAVLDSEDVAAEVPNPDGPPEMGREEAEAQGIQPTHVLPPEEGARN
jgi:hypothetical protein